MATILDAIVETKRGEVAEARQRRPLEAVKDEAAAAGRPRNFYSAVTARPRWGLHLIAEIKRASPSAGLIRADFDPARIAQIYHENGASALSVLTDVTYFQGHLDFIARVKQRVPLPVLRKDFIIDAYQVYESRAAGADAILLIADILTPQQLIDLLILANELNLTSLVEVYEPDTLMRVRSVIGFPHRRYSLLGINNRNLRTQQVDVSHTLRMIDLVQEGTPLVSESGVKTREHVLRLAAAGVSAVLVGETLMRAPDIAAKMRELFCPDAL